MTPYDFVQLTLLAANGQIDGRTKLQKMVYFAGIFTQQIEELGYKAHFFGPYSGAVAGAVEDLRMLDFIRQDVKKYGQNSSSGFEVNRYDYVLTDDGRKMAEAKASENPELWNSIQEAVKKLDRPDARDYVKLSIAAKTYLLLNENSKSLTESELQEMAKSYGWKITPEDVSKAGQLLREWNLAIVGS